MPVFATREFYRELLNQFSKIEGVFVENERADDEDFLVKLSEAASDPDVIIDEDDTTSAENNSSVFSSIVYEGRMLLFTGDAGVDALSRVISAYDIRDIDWPETWPISRRHA